MHVERTWKVVFDGCPIIFAFSQIESKDMAKLRRELEAFDWNGADDASKCKSLLEQAFIYLPKYSSVCTVRDADGRVVPLEELIHAPYFLPLTIAAFDALVNNSADIVFEQMPVRGTA